jgi:hypothetical protein
LLNESDPRFQHVKKWSAEFTEGLRREQQQQQQRSGGLYKEAMAHQAARDYSSAIHALEQIPASLRSPDITALLIQVQGQEERSKSLYEEIRLRVERRELDGLIARVDELLQLVPDRVDLRDLRDTLEKRDQQRLAARSSASLEANRLMDARKYAECVAVLQSIKGSLRTPEIEALQKDAASKQSRLEKLQKMVDQGVKNNQLQGLLARVDELLLLKSDATEGDRQLREQLVAREQKQKSQIKALLQKVHQLRKEVRFDEAMELLRRVPEELQNEAISTAIDDLQFFTDQRSGALEGLTQATDERQIKEALANADEYRGMLTSEIIADTAFETAMKECRQRLEDLQQAEQLALLRRQRQKKLIIIGSVVSLLLLVAIAGFVTQRQQRLTAIADSLQRGDAAILAADFKAAISAYDEVVQLDDTVADAWAGLAIAKLQQTPPDVTGAFSDLEKIAASSLGGEKIQQARRLGHTQRAIEQANAGSISEALQDISDAEKLAAPAEGVTAAKSAVGSAYLKRAEEAVAAKQPEAAVKEFEDARSISPQSDKLPRVSQMIAEAYLERADESLRQSAVEPALAAIEAARAIQADLPRIPELQAAALVIRAQQALQAGNRDKASADFLAAKNLSSGATGLGALAASLADGLVQRCEEAFSDASFQEATAALQTVAELDPQSITLAPLQDRLSKVLIVEADKGLLAKEGDRVFLLIQSLAALKLQPAEQTRLSNALAGQYFENCQQQVAAGDLQRSVSTFERLLALGSVDEEKKQQAVTALLPAIELLCLTGLQSQSPASAINALQSLAQNDVEFGKSFMDAMKTFPEDIKERLPERFFESFELFATIVEGLPIGRTIDRSGSLLAVYEESGESGAVLIVDLEHLDRQPVRINAPVRSLGNKSFGSGMAFLDQLLLIGEPFTTTRAPHDGTGFVYSNIASESPKEIDRFYDPGSDRGGRGRDSGLYFGGHITMLNSTTALFFNGSANGPNRATDVIQFDQAGKASPVGTLEFPHAIQWPARVQDNVMVCLERDKNGAAYLAEYALNGQVITRTEIQNIDLQGATIPGGKPPVTPLYASGGYLAALIPTTADGKEAVLFAFLRRSDGVYETLFTRQEHTGESYTSPASHAVSDGFLFLTTRVAELGVVEGEIRVLKLAHKGQLAEKLPRSSGANVKTHGTHVWAFHDLVVVRDELETGAALRLFRRGFGKRKSPLTSTGRNDESAMAQAAPAPAIAPFDTTQAKLHQKAWADHLGVPVETTNSIGMKFVVIPPDMITVMHPIQIGVYEVTQAEYEKVTGNNPSQTKNVNGPVEMVSWNDAVAFGAMLSALPAEQAAGQVYRLPRRSEWEYACRAGAVTSFSFGNDESQLGEYAWHDANSGGAPHSVGTKLPNAWGLYDMHGNLWEWCEDKTGRFPWRLGGAWSSPGSECRLGGIWNFAASVRRPNLGFRLVMNPSTLVTATDNTASPESTSGPPIAVAPFDAAQAKVYQDAWADYLDVPVESTNSIGMEFRKS